MDDTLNMIPSEQESAISERGLGAHKLSNALDWSFAGRWDHVLTRFGLAKDDPSQRVHPSYQSISCCISLPVRAKHAGEQIPQIFTGQREIAEELL